MQCSQSVAAPSVSTHCTHCTHCQLSSKSLVLIGQPTRHLGRVPPTRKRQPQVTTPPILSIFRLPFRDFGRLAATRSVRVVSAERWATPHRVFRPLSSFTATVTFALLGSVLYQLRRTFKPKAAHGPAHDLVNESLKQAETGCARRLADTPAEMPPPSSGQQKILVAQFVALTGASERQATKYLKSTGYKINEAVDA